MLCHEESGSIYPIPQSVFATDDPTRFNIKCEPLVVLKGVQGYALMQISVIADSQGLSDGPRKASKILPKPGLIARP